MSDLSLRMFRRFVILLSCFAAALLVGSCASVALVDNEVESAVEDSPSKVLWIPMDSDSIDGALDIEGLLGFSTGSLDLSANEFADIAAELASSDSVAESPENLARYRNNVRLVVLLNADIPMISDGCRLVDLKKGTSIELPQKLVDAINSTPPVSKSWACRN